MKLTFLVPTILAFSSIAASAQSAATINQRKVNQQDRIAQGVRSGQLTAGETAHLERREASINREEHNMRRADDGHLTRADRAALTSRQNHVSRAIYRDKHNDRVR
jgi:Ni/Co efflux regulator RcnB